MNLPDDRLFWFAVLVLSFGAVYELWRTTLDLASGLWSAIVSLGQVIAARTARPVSIPVLVRVPVSDSASSPHLPIPTNYLETMSPEEMDRFLSEPGA